MDFEITAFPQKSCPERILTPEEKNQKIGEVVGFLQERLPGADIRFRQTDGGTNFSRWTEGIQDLAHKIQLSFPRGISPEKLLGALDAAASEFPWLGWGNQFDLSKIDALTPAKGSVRPLIPAGLMPEDVQALTAGRTTQWTRPFILQIDEAEMARTIPGSLPQSVRRDLIIGFADQLRRELMEFFPGTEVKMITPEWPKTGCASEVALRITPGMSMALPSLEKLVELRDRFPVLR